MSNQSVLIEIERLLVTLTEKELWAGKDDGEIAQLMRLTVLKEMRRTCWRIEEKVDEQILELKAAKKIVDIRERLDEEIQRLIG